MANIQLLINSIKLLSMSYEEQREYLPDFVGEAQIQDDVLTEFENAFGIIPLLMENKELSYQAVKLILKCNNLIEINLLSADLPESAFEGHPAWESVRDQAREILIELRK